MQKHNRPRSWALLFLGGALALAGGAHAQRIYQEVDGRVVIEAENVTERTTGPNHQWLIVPDEEPNPDPATTDARPAVNPRYLQVLPNGAGGATGPLDVPHADFRVLINTAPATYQLWLRWRGHSGNEDSLYGSIVELKDGDGGVIADWYRYSRGGGSSFINSWHGNAGFERTDASGNDVPATFEIPNPGLYTIRLTFREDGAAVDTLMLQVDTGAAPDEPGPPESKPTGDYPPSLVRTVPGANSINVTPITTIEAGVEDGSDATIVDGSLKLFLDGAELSPVTISRSDDTVEAVATRSGLLAAGSQHTARTTYEDSDGTTYERSWSFTVSEYPTVPAAYRLSGSGATPGMRVGIYQTDYQRLPDENSTASAEQQWARGFLGLDGQPHANAAWFDTGSTDVVNWEPDALDAGNFNPNDYIPGIPGFGNDTTAGREGEIFNNLTIETIAFAQLPAGLVRMGVNSDDGFRVSLAPGQPSVFGLTLGEFDGGRGAADTIFEFLVEETGLYALRLLWWQGGGGASVEWFTEDLETGARTLLNGPGSPFTTYQTAAGNRARVARLLPANGFIAAEPDGGIEIDLEEESTQVQAGSVRLLIDGTEVSASVTKSGATTRVRWTPSPALDFNSDHTGRLVWTETTTPETEWTDDFAFRVRGLDTGTDPAMLLSGPPAEMLPDRVILVWTISKYATQLNPGSLLVQVDDADVTGQAVVTEDATQSYVTVDRSGTLVAEGPHTWSFKWSDTGSKTETIDGTFQVLPPRPPIQANIAWVSFHPADDTPSAAAAAAGFTEAPDAPYTRLLRDNGHTVTRVLTTPTPDVESLNTYDLVIISRSVGSGDYQDPPETAAWNSVRAPTIVLGGYILRDSRLGYTAGGTMLDTVGPIHLKVNAPGHPLFAGVDLDGQGVMVDPYADVASFNDTVQRGISVNTDAVVAGGIVLATVGTDADPTLGGMVIGEFPAGTLTSNGGADLLGGHRLVLLTGSRENSGLTAEGAGIYDLNAEGAKILLNAVQFMAEPPASPGRNIAWVSFHPADDTPADDAATAGFTEAADAGYTQLLRNAGHTVTRVVTSGTPDVAYLNTFDLVMISRSVPSGDYQQAEETALWNGIRQPVVILGGYILRNSRLGFTTGGTMVDTAGAVSLKVEAPGHPLFNGLQLDGQDVLLGGYADLASFNGAAQRGISVNTDAPVAGGVVLATIATEADPTFGGMVIGEFPPGIALSNGAGDVLAGPRLVLLTGSREADGLTSQGAGIFDLNDLSSQLVLNAVDYLAHPPGTALGISVDGANLVITWSPEGGVLEESGDLLNWTAVDGASNPATIPIGTGPAFYRVQQ